MGFREAVEGEGGDVEDDLVLGLPGESLGAHAAPQALFDPDHPRGRALEAHGTAELLGFASAEARRRHGDAQQLLLEDRDTEGALEDRSQRFMGIDHGLSARSAIEVGMNHLSHDRTGSDDRDLDDEIVEGLRLQSGQRRHLGAALDLEDADRVGSTHHGVGAGIIHGQLREVDLDAFVTTDERNRLFERGEHAQAQEVDLDDPEVGAIVLVPLHDATPLHGGGLDGNDFIEAAIGDHDATAVLTEMTGEALDGTDETRPMTHVGRVGVESRLAQPSLEVALRFGVRILASPDRFVLVRSSLCRRAP